MPMPVTSYPTSRPRTTVPRLTALLMAGLAIAGWVPGTGAASPATDAPAAPAAIVPAGSVVAIGGALRYDNSAVWSRLVALAGGTGSRFVVFATAAEDPARSAARASSALEAHGARVEHIPVAPRLPGVDVAQAVRDPALLARVRAARGVFFTGGAQERIVDTLQPGGHPTPMLEAIREVLARGGVVAGTSAGAAVLSGIMFRDATDVVAVMRGVLRDGKEIDHGLGVVAPGLFVDQHFLARGRLGRMLPLMQSRGLQLGIGVEENSAAILRGRELEVVGEGGALIVDLADATTDAGQGAFNIAGVRLTYLGDGDRFDLRTRALTPSSLKIQGSLVDPRAAGFQPSLDATPFLLDALADGAVLRAMTGVLDGASAEVRGLAFDGSAEAAPPRDLGFEFRFYRGPDTLGWYTAGAGQDAYTVANVRLDVAPVRVAQPLYRSWQP